MAVSRRLLSVKKKKINNNKLSREQRGMLFWRETVGVTCQNEDQRKPEDTRGPETMKTHSFLVEGSDEALKEETQKPFDFC